MVEPILSGIVLGMITVSAMGLFVAAFLQYRRLAGEGNGKCHRKDTALHSLWAVKGKGEMVR